MLQRNQADNRGAFRGYAHQNAWSSSQHCGSVQFHATNPDHNGSWFPGGELRDLFQPSQRNPISGLIQIQYLLKPFQISLDWS